MNIGSWIGQALVAHMLARDTHWLIVRTLEAMGWIRPEFRLSCVTRIWRPAGTGPTHFSRALRLTCTIWQQVVAG